VAVIGYANNADQPPNASRFYALSSMQDQVAASEETTVKFLRQLYNSCLERLGEEHAQTRLLLENISAREGRLFLTPSELPACVLPHQPSHSCSL
jgi:hypothetical protein